MTNDLRILKPVTWLGKGNEGGKCRICHLLRLCVVLASELEEYNLIVEGLEFKTQAFGVTQCVVGSYY